MCSPATGEHRMNERLPSDSMEWVWMSGRTRSGKVASYVSGMDATFNERTTTSKPIVSQIKTCKKTVAQYFPFCGLAFQSSHRFLENDFFFSISPMLLLGILYVIVLRVGKNEVIIILINN